VEGESETLSPLPQLRRKRQEETEGYTSPKKEKGGREKGAFYGKKKKELRTVHHPFGPDTD